jgi:hypothetical protein
MKIDTASVCGDDQAKTAIPVVKKIQDVNSKNRERLE